MIGMMGDVLLMLVLSLASYQAIAPWLATRLGNPRHLQAMRHASLLQASFAAMSMLLLMAAYASSDFSLLNVYLNSHTHKPLLYKITGSWGNHEGSMLLWLVMFSSLSTVAGLWRGGAGHDFLRVQGWMVAGLAAYILFTSSPFTLVLPAPEEGQGLNPLLQDIGLAMHPPMLYLGYVGFGVVFVFATSALVRGQAGPQLARTLQPWIAFSWACLTMGIGLGSWWAYRELGWGGWWFWDPVEDVSLMPWLSGTALLHANIVLQKRGQMASWTVLLAIITFALSLMGTFLVRSGVLISVHSFASDPARGTLILLYVTVIITVALYYFCRRGPLATDAQTAPLVPFSRAGFILMNHVFMLAAAATILLAIIYPMLLTLLGMGSISVGAPYFNATVLPLMAPAVLLAGIAPLMHWHKHDARALLRTLAPVFVVCGVVAALLLAYVHQQAWLTAGGSALGLWLLLTSAQMVGRTLRQNKRLPLHVISTALAHGGFGIFVIALTFNGLHSTSYQRVMQVGDHAQAGDIHMTFAHQHLGTHNNYGLRRATVKLASAHRPTLTLQPELRYYPERAMHTTEAAIDSGWLRDVYLASSLQDDPKALGFALYENAAMRWLWIGFALVTLGGFVSAARQRMIR